MGKGESKARLATFQSAVQPILADMVKKRIVARVWAQDHRLWKPQPIEIDNRLGWLTVAEQMQPRVPALQSFAISVRKAGFRHVVLLGMGGSSLGPEVLARTFRSARGFPALIVLDSTVPGAVRAVTRAVDPVRTLFIVASKSGGTIEVMSLFAHFWATVKRARGNTGGSQFIAITDPGTSLGTLAQDRGFRTTFINPQDIGGRYSVLSYFGLVPAALMGIDVDALLQRAVQMARACGPGEAPVDNPGAYLGAAMAALARMGRDKVTIVASPKVKTFGLWAEQLLAESTGKEGKGLIPIAQEPMASPAAYGSDRLFICLRVDGDTNATLDRHVTALERTGQPVVRLRLRDAYDLGAEFFRWEFATAVASHYLGIHPFDQPNVQESKENTARLLAQFQEEGTLPTLDSSAALTDLLEKAMPGNYLAILAYMRPLAQADAALSMLRKAVMVQYRLATTAGYGPRYLHSTGQLHKGGPNQGLFLQCVGDMSPDLKVPEQPYTFATLAQAQAVGDLQSLQAHGRPVVRVQMGRRVVSSLRGLIPMLARTRRPSRASGSGRRTR